VGFDEDVDARQAEILEVFRSLLSISLGASRSTYREEEGFIIDQLTPLKTEHYYQNRLDQEIERGNRYDSEFSVLVLEVNDLDAIRDTHGDSAQLEVIRKLAHLIQNTFRMVDVACRFKDDQFGIIYPNTSIEGALTAAQRFDRLVENLTLTIGESEISITIHGGLASYPEDGESAEELLKQARLALYEAKHSEEASLQSSQELDDESTEDNG
jgi:diguanylate cyclase (GGDEF)-like protein